MASTLVSSEAYRKLLSWNIRWHWRMNELRLAGLLPEKVSGSLIFGSFDKPSKVSAGLGEGCRRASARRPMS